MKLLVFELNSFHVDLLPMYTQLFPAAFGDDHLDVQYFVLPRLVKRARGFVGDGVRELNSPMLRWVLPSKRLRSFYYRRRVQWIVDRSDATAVVFNTIEPVAYFRVFRSLRHPLKLGVVHNPHREGIDYEPRPANEIVLCLHDYNYRRLEAEKPVDGWLSPFFRGGGMPRGATPADTTEIAVQGVVSFNRRNYRMLVDVCREFANTPHPPSILFNILGDSTIRDGPALRESVVRHRLERFFRFHRWLSDTEFTEQLQRADYIMPLLHQDEGQYSANAKVTLAYGNSGAYGIPLLLHRDLATEWGLPDDTCVTYAGVDELAQTLAQSLRDDMAAHASCYRQFVDAKIRENRDFLRRLVRHHQTFSHARSG